LGHHRHHHHHHPLLPRTKKAKGERERWSKTRKEREAKLSKNLIVRKVAFFEYDEY